MYLVHSLTKIRIFQWLVSIAFKPFHFPENEIYEKNAKNPSRFGGIDTRLPKMHTVFGGIEQMSFLHRGLTSSIDIFA